MTALKPKPMTDDELVAEVTWRREGNYTFDELEKECRHHGIDAAFAFGAIFAEVERGTRLKLIGQEETPADRFLRRYRP